MSIFDDDVFHIGRDAMSYRLVKVLEQGSVPSSSVLSEGYIPGWSVTLAGRLLGHGLSERTAVRICAEYAGSEIWGYGRTLGENWPHAPMRTTRLAHNDAGVFRKTGEYPK